MVTGLFISELGRPLESLPPRSRSSSCSYTMLVGRFVHPSASLQPMAARAKFFRRPVWFDTERCMAYFQSDLMHPGLYTVSPTNIMVRIIRMGDSPLSERCLILGLGVTD